MEFLFEIVGELLLQMVFEVMAEFGLQSLSAPFRKRPNPWLAALGYTILGAIVGGVSLWLFPSHLVATKALRLANVIITPLLVGLGMSAVGAWRAHRGQTVLRIDRFAYGYLFALMVALIRFYFAK
jgi:hypothetical protein